LQGAILNSFAAFVLANTQWLYTRIHENPVFFVDLWSVVHFWSGFCLMTCLRRPFPARKWVVLTGLLSAWELLELFFIYIAFGVFLPETLKDQATDILVGLLGGLVCESVVRWQNAGAVRRPTVAAVFVALTLPFFWVGSYGYQYNHDALNSSGLNWWAFLLWFAFSLFLSAYYATHHARSRSHRTALLGTMAGYAAVLLSIEYLGYVVLGIHETGHQGDALVFGLIHGTPVLWGVYLCAPLLNTAAYLAATRHVGWMAQTGTPVGRRAVTLDSRRAGAPRMSFSRN
jgi:hypothetical protein